MSTVRRAVLTDIPAILEMARDMHAESPRYRTLGFDADKVCNVAYLLITAALPGGVLVAEDGDRLVGMLAFEVCSFYFSEERLASDLVMYLRPENRGGALFPRMVKAFEDWATSTAWSKSN